MARGRRSHGVGPLEAMFAQYDHIVSHHGQPTQPAAAAPPSDSGPHDPPPWWSPELAPTEAPIASTDAKPSESRDQPWVRDMKNEALRSAHERRSDLGMLGGKVGAAAGAGAALAGMGRYAAPEIAEGLAETGSLARVGAMAPEIAQYGMQQFARGAVGELSGAAAGARMGEAAGPYGAIAGGLLGAAMVGSQAGQQAGDYMQAYPIPDQYLPKVLRVNRGDPPPRSHPARPYGGGGIFGRGPW